MTISPALVHPTMFVEALVESLRKLDPRHMCGNPVMLVVEIGAVLTTILTLHRRGGHARAGSRRPSPSGCGSR